MKSPSSNTSRTSPSSTSRNGDAIATTTIEPDAQTLYALQIPHVYGTSDHSIGGRTQFSSKERSPPSPLHSINNSSPVVHPIVKSPPYLLMDAPPPSVYAPNSNYHPQQQPYHTPRMLPGGPPAPPAPPAIAPGLPQIAVPMPNHGATWAHACHDPGLHVPGYSSTQYPPSASHTAAPSAAAPSYPPHAHGPPPALPSSSTMDSTTTHAGYHPTADRTVFQSTYYNQGIMTSSLQCSALRSPRHITSSISSVSQHTPVPPYTSGPPSMTSAPAAAQQDGQSNNIPQSQNSDSTSLISRPISNLSQSNHANPYVLVTQQESGQDVKNWVVPPPAKRSKPASGSTDMVTNRAVCELQRAISNSLSSIICIFKSPANNHEQRTDLVYGNAKFLNRFSCEIDEMRVKKKMVPGSLKQLIYADDRNVFCGSVELIKKDPKSNPRFVVRIIDKINALPEMGQDCSYSYSFVEMSMQVASISEHYLVTMRPLYATGEYTSRHICKDCLRSNIGTNKRFEEITDDGMIMNSLVRSYEDEKNRVTPLLGPPGIC